MTQPPGADIVIVAAGRSQRMAGRDKLSQDVFGRPLLAWTVARMSLVACLRRLVLVVAPERVDEISRADWLPDAEIAVVAGGDTRSDSVRAGLAASRAEIVLVHDGARPLATPALADSVAAASAEHGAAAPVLEVVDSLKRLEDGRLAEVVERSGLVRAQTPQGARRELLLDAFARASGRSFGDEAALLQEFGVAVAAVPGEASNLKVTQPGDLEIVRALLADGSTTHGRQGFGQDSHPFGPEDGLWLGGMLLEDAPRLFGHSDGDVALHALASALLTAAGLGDLGRHFPAGEPQTRGVASTVLLGEVVQLVAAAGWRPASAQLSLLGARPRLGASRLETMRRRMAELLGVAPELFALSASSGNLNGPEGAGRSISASALVSLVRR